MRMEYDCLISALFASGLWHFILPRRVVFCRSAPFTSVQVLFDELIDSLRDSQMTTDSV